MVMITSTNAFDFGAGAGATGLNDSFIEVALQEATRLLQEVLARGPGFAPSVAAPKVPFNDCCIDPLAETLALFNADW
jgi:hypothetical protein